MKTKMSSIKIVFRARNLIFISVFFYSSTVSFAQEITEENYLKLDKELWEQVEIDMGKLYEFFDKHPEKIDSLIKVADSISNVANKKNRELATKYASVPSGLQRLYQVRLELPKDTLQSILSRLPDNMRNSPYKKSILLHINSEQIKEGNRFYDFEAVTSEGKKFELSSLKGKNVLLLYGGLYCMREEGRRYLDSLYRETYRNDFEIVVYCPVNNLESLKEERKIYSCDYILVSDFLQDHTPVKILYGAQGTPTCFFISKQGVMEMKTEGLHGNEKQINELVYRNK